MTSSAFRLRRLTPADAADFAASRVEALGDAPTAFGMSVPEEEEITVPEYQDFMREAFADGGVWLGAYDRAGILIGTLCFRREEREKLRHKGWLWGMYVTPHYRTQGVARSLLDEMVTTLQQNSDIQQVLLHVTVGNVAARKLYESVGFIGIGVEPRALLVDGEFYEQETMYFELG